MIAETLYTTAVLGFSFGFLATSFVIMFFMEDKTRYYIPLFAICSIGITLILETLFFGFPSFAFAPFQLYAIPITTLASLGIFFFTIHIYIKRNSFY